jgi:hypothetical protein
MCGVRGQIWIAAGEGEGIKKQVKIRTMQDIDSDALRYYIRQALDFDAG